MDLQLFSIKRAPKDLPIWQTILEDLGHPDVKGVAKALGVSEHTIYRWNHAGRAPRTATLALFWLTRWGHSLIHTSATNDALLYAQLARSLQREISGYKSRLDTVNRDRNQLRMQVVKLTALIVGNDENGGTAEAEEQAGEDDGLLGGQSQNETFRKVLLDPSGPKPSPGGRIVRLLDREPAAARQVAKDMGVGLKTVTRLERRQARRAARGRAGQDCQTGTYRTVLLDQSDEDRPEAGTAGAAASASFDGLGTLPGSCFAGQVQGRSSAPSAQAREAASDGQQSSGWREGRPAPLEASAPASSSQHRPHRSAGQPDMARPGTPASATRLRRSLGASPQPPEAGTGRSAFDALVSGAIAQGTAGTPPTTRPSAISTRYAPLRGTPQAAQAIDEDQEDA